MQLLEIMPGKNLRPCHLLGITPEGSCFDVGAKHYNDSELVGCCFSPDREILFVNSKPKSGSGLRFGFLNR